MAELRNIFADDTTLSRTAAIQRRLRVLERNPIFGQQRAYGRQVGTAPLAATYLRPNVAAVTVYVPEGSARLRFSAVGLLSYAGVQSGGAIWTIYNVFEPADAIYTGGVLASYGDSVDEHYGGNVRALFNDMGLLEYRPNVSGQQTYAVDCRYSTGAPVGVSIASVSLNVEVI